MNILSKVQIGGCFVCVAILANTAVLKAQQLNLIPYPGKVELLKGNVLHYNTALYTHNSEFAKLLLYFNQEVGVGTKNNEPKQLIYLKIIPSSVIQGSYVLTTAAKRLSITANDTAGLLNGLATLLQLYQSATKVNGKVALPRTIIHDQPRFQWRGFMLDESRHFFGKDKVKELLDWMAFYKLNRFHWHLTDSHGWRIEIKKYPLLTTIGGKGNFTDSLATPAYYTQQDIKEIVLYAKQRGIAIIPEIDMPGHATAANHAYPAFSGGYAPGFPNFTFNPGKEETYAYISAILTEIKSLFPSGMIHIGGDEVTLGVAAWEKSVDVQKLKTTYQLTDLNEVEHYFLRRIADSVIKHGDKVLCWDEAVSANLPVKNTIVSWWRQNKPESLNQAIAKGYQVILCPRLPLYFDFVQDSTHVSGRKWDKQYNTCLDIYHFPESSLPANLAGNSNITGLQANLWTETVGSYKRLQYLVFPRMAALAEAGWTGASAKNDEAFNMRLKWHLSFYAKKHIYYYDPFNPALHPEAIDFTPIKPQD